jgi:hypothetical protein
MSGLTESGHGWALYEYTCSSSALSGGSSIIARIDRHHASCSEWRPPSPNQFGCGEGNNTRNQEQKYRDCQVGLLFEFFKTFIDPRRSSRKDWAHEEENRDRGGNERYDFEKHFSPSSLL